jgi:hypothetical protein
LQVTEFINYHIFKIFSAMLTSPYAMLHTHPKMYKMFKTIKI